MWPKRGAGIDCHPRERWSMGVRRAGIIAAILVLICFFLPWVQVSFLGLEDSASGLDLAREGDTLLWLVPALALAIIVFGLLRPIWGRAPMVFALTSTAGGAISAYLMYRQYSSGGRSAGLVASQWTPWFWLGLMASIVVIVAAFIFYGRQSRTP
ncbi:MAG TPA: hypothetical protein VNO14_03775 [Blastocatellia bacterium]|nr:hypothetical protein [Blastocatellia bacterium]